MKLVTHEVGRGSEPRGVDEHSHKRVVFCYTDYEDEKPSPTKWVGVQSPVGCCD